ncbi:MAG TPA: hypothetical protein VEB20_11570 [Azospirillaceae bacterium]|nr:hypothetical protein [Azospirillaceae bacterium]
MRGPRLLCAAAALTLWSGTAAADGLPDLTLRAMADLRLVRTPDEVGWRDGGLGLTRYGGDGAASQVEPQLAELALVPTLHLASGLDATAYVRVEPDQDTVVDVVEAYLRYRPVSTSRWRWSGRAGAFFPPVSLENDGLAWSSRYSLTPSAINSWIGEEVRAIGAEGTLEWRGDADRLKAFGSVFGWNDAAGILVAYRGWALHDRWTGLNEDVRMPDEIPLHLGGRPPLSRDIFLETDDRAGWYAGGEWARRGLGRLTAMRYDNRTDPRSFNGQFGWQTRFWSAGAELTPLPGLTLLAQGMVGDTEVWPNRILRSWTDFEAFYLLASQEIGRWRLTARFDAFGTEERSLSHATRKQLGGNGKAYLAAVSHRPHDRVRVTLELLHVDSTRQQRLAVDLPEDAAETQVQASVRLFF